MSGRTDIATLFAGMDPTLSAVEVVFCPFPVAGRLTRHGTSANVVAAYYHDHVFVPIAVAERALAVLRTLRAEAAASGGCSRSGG